MEEANDIDNEKKTIQQPPEEIELKMGKEEKKYNKYIQYILVNKFFFIAILIIIVTIFLLVNDEYKEEREIKGNWDISYKKADEFINKLNLTEQINLLFGTQNMKIQSILIENESEKKYLCEGLIDPFKNSKLNFKGMCLQDGPAGVRFANGTSISWQAGINNAATFNRKLMKKVGKAQGEELKIKGINTVLGPVANILRSPQGGRGWEAYGDDPYYTGICASEVIKGIQSQGVIANIKHFVGNDQETYRKASSSNMDLATLMDIYVEPFYRAIKDANVGSIMSAFNAVNNTYCAESKFILTDVLRKILGFRGFVVSDWWGVYSDHPNTINSGLDLNMPGGYNGNPRNEKHKYDNYGREHSFWTHLEDFVKEKKVEEKRIKEAATRIIATMYEMNQMENFPSVDLYRETITKKKIKLQRKAATESQVLLKNDGILPLKKQKFSKIAVIGNDAFEQDCLNSSDCSCRNLTNKVFNGHIPLGYGSGATTFNYLVSPLEGIKNLAKKYKMEILESGKLNYIDEEINGIMIHVNATEDIDGGVKVAKDSDAAIIFVKSISGEEYLTVENTIGDRPDLDVFHNGNELIEKCAEVNKNIIVVINAPAVVNLPWRDKVKAIIFSGFPGAESGNAIADILFGEVNPSGHLPFVWGEFKDYPFKIDHLNNFTIYNETSRKVWKDVFRYKGIDSSGLKDDAPGHEKEQYNYTEGLYVGQRWFNKNNIKPIFPFGHGLSYSTFEFNNLEVSLDKNGLKATFSVKNNSSEKGKVVPMMFLTFPDNIGEYPKHIFKGFEKVKLKPDESKKITIEADNHALSYFNIEKNDYTRVDNGIIKVCIAENADPSQVLLSQEINAQF